jgi:hypothetical protein
MTQTNLLELAKQGNPQAIASLMNRSLQPRGITATTELLGDCLHVVLEAEQIPNRQVLTTFVQNGMKNLGVRSIRSVRVVGKQTGLAESAWTQEIELENYSRLSDQLGIVSPEIQSTEMRDAVAPPPPPRHRLTPPSTDQPSTATNPQPPVTVMAADVVQPTPPPYTPPAYPEWKPTSEEAEVDISSLTSLDSLNRTGQFDPPPSDFPETTILPEDVANNTPYYSSPVEDYLEEDATSVNSYAPYQAGQYMTSDQSITPQEIEAARILELDSNSQPVEFPMQSTYINRQTRLQSMDEQNAIEPAEDVEEEADLEEDEPAGSGGNFWGALAAMLTGVLALAIIAYALWSYFKPTREPDPVVGQAPAPVAPNSPPASPNLPTAPATPTPPPASPQGDVFQQGIQASEAALAQVQTAQTPADWQQAANRLQGAIALLQQVPADNPNYNVAQQKIAELQNQLNTAQQQASVAAAGTTAPPAAAVPCQSIPLSPTSPPVELSSLRFSADGNYVEGCVTNHTNQPIVSVSVSYLGSSGQNANQSQSGLNNISFTALEPGRTVPFRSSFTVDPSISKVRIEALFWTPAGSVQPQPQQASVEANR